MAASIQVTLELDDRGFLTGIKAAEAEVQKLGVTADATAAKSSGMFGKISADADMAIGRLKGLLIAYVGLEAVMSSLKLADNLKDLSNASGISIEKILGLQEGLAKAGGNADDAGKMIAKLTQSLDQARQMAPGAQDTLRRLGFSLQEMGTLTPEAALDKTIAKLATLTNPVERNALAFELLGKSARNIDWLEVQKSLTDSSGKFTEAAIAAQKAGDAFDKIEEHAKNMKIALMIAITPLIDLGDYLEKLGKSGGITAMGVLKTVFETIAVVGANVAFVVKTVIDDIVGLGEAGDALLHGNWAEATAIMAKRKAEAAALRKELDEFEKRVLNPAKAPDAPKPKKTTDGTTSAGDAFAAEKNGILSIADAYARANEKQRASIQLGYDNIGITSAQQKLRTEDNRIIQSATDEIIKLQQKYDGLSMAQKRAGEGDTIITAIQNVIKYRDQDRLAAEEQIKANERYQRSFGKGWQDAFNAYVDNATNAANQGKAIFDAVTNGMNAAIDEFVMKGTFSFQNFSKGIIQEILKIQMKAAIGGLMGATGLGSLFGPPGKAAGGPVEGGSPYLVGENGPELFMPKGAGTIVPNNQISGMGGGQTIINNNVSAIDAKSVAQLFAENRMMLFGNVEQARRELPMRTR
jgi:phage-related minor tail protein